jgi:hypothetical protein
MYIRPRLVWLCSSSAQVAITYCLSVDQSLITVQPTRLCLCYGLDQLLDFEADAAGFGFIL